MHMIQKDVQEIDYLDDESLIEQVAEAWGIVCRENKDHKDYVPQDVYGQWVNYKKSVDEKILPIVEDYTGSITAKQRESLLSIASSIAKAQHKSENDFLAEIDKNANNERVRVAALEEKEQEQERLTKKKTSWMKLILGK